MLTSGTEVDLLAKLKDPMTEGGYVVLGYNTADNTVYPKFILKDRKGNSLKVLAFDNDPITGKPFVSGMVIDPKRGNNFESVKDLSRGPYCGVYTINLNGHTRKDIQASFSYWNDGSQTFVDKHGYYKAPGMYANVEHSFRDYQGNTYFAACQIRRKLAVGGIIASVITLPLLYPPMAILSYGVHRYTSHDVMLLRQDPSGKLSLVNTIPALKGDKATPGTPLSSYGPGYYTVTNPDTKTDYLVVDDKKSINIYNINQKRIARTIPHKEGSSIVTVFPAKEGYVMVYEYDQKEKTTRMSIESL
jgi:hypothetical protein